MPVRTFDTRTWLFLPDTNLWENKTPTKKSKTWIAASSHLYNLSLLLSHFHKLPLFRRFMLPLSLSLSLSAAHWGVLLYGLIEVKMWRTYTDSNWGPTKKFSACVGWLNVQKGIKNTHEKNSFMYLSGPQDKKIFIFRFELMQIDTYVSI